MQARRNLRRGGRRRNAASKSTSFPTACVLGLSAFLFVTVNVFFLQHVLQETTAADTSICPFRRYPEHRYYQLSERNTAPDFLKGQNEYIYGEWPILLPSDTPKKICVDQSAWLPKPTNNLRNDELPFADGTNPSILSLQRIRDEQKEHGTDNNLDVVPPGTVWVATACMTNSQCAWNDSPQQVKEYRISTQSQPSSVHTVLLFLDENFGPLAQSSIYLRRDAPWGRRKTAKLNLQGQPEETLPALDDARLFLHRGEMWVSYREGPAFGYDTQVLNRIRWDDQRHATVLASETTSFCCGRNMALMEDRTNPNQLKSLTWVDPVTVADVDTSLPSAASRRLAAAPGKHKSHIHGTNAFMLYLPDSDEFLGVAHFHRPNDRKVNPYARFGHHYTHAFYTVTTQAPFRLTGLSPEFVLPSIVDPGDAEIIQFASGLELSDDRLVIAYGINDCEAAATTIVMTSVRTLLRPVASGKEVVDFMRPLQAS